MDKSGYASEEGQYARAASLLRTLEQERALEAVESDFAAIRAALAIENETASEPRTKSTEPIRIATFDC